MLGSHGYTPRTHEAEVMLRHTDEHGRTDGAGLAADPGYGHGELFRRLPDLRITGEPARLLSGFINGIKHMPCEFTPSGR